VALPVILDPRITAQDLNESLILSVGAAVLEDMAVTVSVRTNFLTIEIGAEEHAPPSILWIPMTTLMPAIAEISKKAGC
jgi:hypothetical protein